MNADLINHVNKFERLRHATEQGIEFWYARDLQIIFEYSRWEKFENVIEKAIIACEHSGYDASDHFHLVVKMVNIGSAAERKIQDFQLSRYACYLIVQNADPNKAVIAQGQTYFAVQTRRQELQDDVQFKVLSEDQKRLKLRGDLTHHNKNLASAAKEAGVINAQDYAIFQNHGYQGLYGGLSAKDIHMRKGLKKSEQILDHMGSTELAANLFRATQTEEKLKRDQVKERNLANQTHFEVGKKVRQTIKELGGTMPENLSKPDKGIKYLEKEQKKLKKSFN